MNEEGFIYFTVPFMWFMVNIFHFTVPSAMLNIIGSGKNDGGDISLLKTVSKQKLRKEAGQSRSFEPQCARDFLQPSPTFNRCHSFNRGTSNLDHTSSREACERCFVFKAYRCFSVSCSQAHWRFLLGDCLHLYTQSTYFFFFTVDDVKSKVWI